MEGRSQKRIAAALPLAVFALLALVSWNRWIEPYVDTGRELMVPVRVAQGERLYRDIPFLHGPLAPYLGAAVERTFERSLPARTALAAVIALLHVAALGGLSRRLLSPWRAALATSLAVAAAVFLRPGGWLFPFSFDAAIAVAALTWALFFATREPPAADGRAGACLAAALLARPELGLAGAALLVLAAARERRRWTRLAVWPLGAAGAAYALVSLGIPLDRLVAEGWLQMIDPPAAVQNVYRAYAGLDRVGFRSVELLLCAIVLLVAAALLCGAAFAAARLEPRHRAAALGLQVLAVGILLCAAAARFRPPAALAETLPLFPPLVRVIPPCLALAAALRLLARLSGRAPRGPFSAVPDAVLWVAALFGFRLLLAAGYVGPYDAFFLPLPIVVAAAGLFGLADRAAPAIGRPLPGLTFAALGVFLLFRIAAMADLYRRPGWSEVETPAGRVVLQEPVATTTGLALLDLARRLPPGAALAGFPEAGFIRYALGLRNPLPHEQFFPDRLDAAGEDRMIALFRQRPPEATLYANVLAVGEGARVFGTDYLEKLDAAVRSRTRTAAVYGPGGREGAAIGDPGFFVEIRVPAEVPGP